MALTGWTKRSYGCAVADDACLAVGVRYHAADRVLRVEEAWAGTLSDKSYTSRLARRLGRKPLWVPLALNSDGERGDIRILAVDDDDGKIKLREAVVTQLQAEEADKMGAYTRVSARFDLGSKKTHVIGASAPEAAVVRTRGKWSERGFLKPCVGSLHMAAVNLFLALHPDARADEPLHRLLACRLDGADYFCYLRRQAFMDSGVSTGGGEGVESLLDHLGAWGGKFEQKHHFSENASIRAYVVQAGAPSPRQEELRDAHLDFWGLPWGTAVTFATAAVEETLRNICNPLALPALGLALHGV